MFTESTFVPLTGSCTCGKIRFRMDQAPIITHACHCRSCQKATGAAFCVHAMIERDQLTVLEGEPEAFQGAASHKVLQCPDCRVKLWEHIAPLGDAIALVGVGALDHGKRLPPEAHYFIRSKHPWVTLPPGIPAFEQHGDAGKPGARERVMAALARAGIHGVAPPTNEPPSA